MGSQTQNATLKEFKAGCLNTLFSTAVAEEGLDLKACQLVVSPHCDSLEAAILPALVFLPSWYSYDSGHFSPIPDRVDRFRHLFCSAANCGVLADSWSTQRYLQIDCSLYMARDCSNVEHFRALLLHGASLTMVYRMASVFRIYIDFSPCFLDNCSSSLCFVFYHLL